MVGVFDIESHQIICLVLSSWHRSTRRQFNQFLLVFKFRIPSQAIPHFNLKRPQKRSYSSTRYQSAMAILFSAFIDIESAPATITDPPTVQPELRITAATNTDVELANLSNSNPPAPFRMPKNYPQPTHAGTQTTSPLPTQPAGLSARRRSRGASTQLVAAGAQPPAGTRRQRAVPRARAERRGWAFWGYEKEAPTRLSEALERTASRRTAT